MYAMIINVYACTIVHKKQKKKQIKKYIFNISCEKEYRIPNPCRIFYLYNFSSVRRTTT